MNITEQWLEFLDGNTNKIPSELPSKGVKLTMDKDAPVYLSMWIKRQRVTAAQKRSWKPGAAAPTGEQRKLKPAEVKKLVKLGVQRVGEDEGVSFRTDGSKKKSNGKKSGGKKTKWVYDSTENKSKRDLKNGNGGGLEKRTVVELKQLAKSRGKKGYSKLKKAELVALLRNGNGNGKKTSAKKKTVTNEMTVVQLRILCKKNGIKGYSKWNKARLIKECKK